MGGTPISALAIVCFPEKGDTEVLGQILAGGLSKMMEAKCTVVGGHSVRDPEIKFGYAATGTLHPKKVLTNAAAQAGDVLILTKPIGTGGISTAIQKRQAKPKCIEAAPRAMTDLNSVAAGIAVSGNFQVHAATDITGFGLIGHLREVALGSNVSVCLRAASVAVLAGAVDCIQAGFIPGGLKSNREFAECNVSYAPDVPEELKTILYDPQTAGGLLFSVAQPDAAGLLSALQAAGLPAFRGGGVLAAAAPPLRVEI